MTNRVTLLRMVYLFYFVNLLRNDDTDKMFCFHLTFVTLQCDQFSFVLHVALDEFFKKHTVWSDSTRCNLTNDILYNTCVKYKGIVKTTFTNLP